jgi:hypothetical protein
VGCHAGPLSRLGAARGAFVPREKWISGCAAPCRTLIGASSPSVHRLSCASLCTPPRFRTDPSHDLVSVSWWDPPALGRDGRPNFGWSGECLARLPFRHAPP